MSKFENNVYIGTAAQIEDGRWGIVREIHESRQWVKITPFGGSFQRGHIIKFTNSKVKIGSVMKKIKGI